MTDTALKWIPRFDFGDSSIELTYPLTRWNPGARTEGRVLKAINGVPGPSLRLRKYLLGFTIRYTEEEWPSIIEFMTFAQTGASFLWFLRAQDDLQPEFVSVWLESPHIKDGVKPKRDDTLLWLFTLPIVISRMSGPWDLEYFRIPTP